MIEEGVHEMLMDCCVQFVLKDINIGLYIIILLTYWPFQSCSKYELFLQEIVGIRNTIMTVSDGINLFKNNKSGIIVRQKLIECIVSDNV